MFDKLTEEKPKPLPPEIPKKKEPITSNRDRRTVKIVKSTNESPGIAKEDKPPSSIPDSYSNFNYDYTPSPATSDLPSEQSYSSGYNSISGTPAYNGTYPYPYNRYVQAMNLSLKC